MWDDDDALFAAWSEGRTGFPFVDAGMPQLADLDYPEPVVEHEARARRARELFEAAR